MNIFLTNFIISAFCYKIIFIIILQNNSGCYCLRSSRTFRTLSWIMIITESRSFWPRKYAGISSIRIMLMSEFSLFMEEQLKMILSMLSMSAEVYFSSSLNSLNLISGFPDKTYYHIIPANSDLSYSSIFKVYRPRNTLYQGHYTISVKYSKQKKKLLNYQELPSVLTKVITYQNIQL